MAENNLSQQVARIFEIFGYVLLVPSTLGLLVGASMIFYGVGNAYIGLAICETIFFGIILLIGYYKHSRDRLTREKTFALWIATILYNGLFLLLATFYTFSERKILGDGFFGFFGFYGLMAMWWILAIIGSAIALNDLYSNQKYR